MMVDLQETVVFLSKEGVGTFMGLNATKEGKKKRKVYERTYLGRKLNACLAYAIQGYILSLNTISKF